MGFLIAAIGAALIALAFLGQQVGIHITLQSEIFLAVFGLALMATGSWMASISYYRRTSADQAFVRTGRGGSKVVLDGGDFVFPFLHSVREINLKTMKLGVNPKGQNALITHDNLRANVLAQFYIRVQADEEHILNAARSLGENSVNAETVEALVSEKLVSALRAIASQMDLFEIHTKRDEFAERVKEHVKVDLESNGLLLESVTISELDQTDPGELSDNNVFDAQGKKKITEITAAAAVERNNLERESERARKLKDVQTRQLILEMERQQAEAEFQQQSQIAKVKAGYEREAQEALIGQQKQVELTRIEKERTIQEQEIARDQAIEVAKMQQEQAVQTAQVTKEQQIQMAAVERDKSVSLADRLKEVAVAQQETARAKAQEEALLAAAQREKANQQVTTVTQLAEAQREADKKLIAAQQQIQQDKLRLQTVADVDAYTVVKKAEAEQESAAKQAQAIKQQAEAQAQAKEMVARGDLAQQKVAIDIAREQVNVEQAKVAVERQQLENRQEFAEAGIKLEIQKLSISAGRDVQMEFARAMAGFLTNGHMTLYGTPETAASMLDNMAKGFGIRAGIEGFLHGDSSRNGYENGSSVDQAGIFINQITSLIKPVISKALGGASDKLTPEVMAGLAGKLVESPDFLRLIQEAIAAANPVQAVVGQPIQANATVSQQKSK